MILMVGMLLGDKWIERPKGAKDKDMPQSDSRHMVGGMFEYMLKIYLYDILIGHTPSSQAYIFSGTRLTLDVFLLRLFPPAAVWIYLYLHLYLYL